MSTETVMGVIQRALALSVFLDTAPRPREPQHRERSDRQPADTTPTTPSGRGRDVANDNRLKPSSPSVAAE